MKILRWSIGALGVAAIVYGIAGIPRELKLVEIYGLLAWLAIALFLHDGILIPVSQVLGGGLRRISSGWSRFSVAVIRSGVMAGACLTLIALPLLKAQSVAEKPTLLQENYASWLGIFWLAVVMLVAVIVFIYEYKTRAKRI